MTDVSWTIVNKRANLKCIENCGRPSTKDGTDRFDSRTQQFLNDFDIFFFFSFIGFSIVDGVGIGNYTTTKSKRNISFIFQIAERQNGMRWVVVGSLMTPICALYAEFSIRCAAFDEGNQSVCVYRIGIFLFCCSSLIFSPFLISTA